MNKLLITITVILVCCSLSYGYQWTNESGYTVNIEFANGGTTTDTAEENHTSMLGGQSIPFNQTGITYDIHQGLLYLIWSNIRVGEITYPPTITCEIVHAGLEWGEINCSCSGNQYLFMAIMENATNISYQVFDTRNESIRKFIGLKEDTSYVVQVNCTDANEMLTIESKYLHTKSSGGWNIMITLFYFALCLAVVLMAIGFYLNNQPLLAISGLLWGAVGVYLIINGWVGYDNLITAACGSICCGIGGYFLTMATLSMIEGGYTEDDW